MTTKKTTTVDPEQRFTSERPCPICGGDPSLPRGKGHRCAGYFGSDSELAYCTREEFRGTLESNGTAGYAHRLHGACGCGREHGKRTTATKKIAPVGDHFFRILDAQEKLIAIHRRIDDGKGGKELWWERDGKKSLGGLQIKDLPFFNLPALVAAPFDAPVIVTEGERACLTLTSRGLLAVGTVTGAPAFPADDVLRPLIGHDVLLWPDNDDDGRKQASSIEARLRAMGQPPAIVRRITWAEAPAKGDAADFTGTTEELQRLIADARTSTDGDGARAIVASSVQRKQVTYLDPGHRIPKRAVTAFVGAPGLGKTTLALFYAAAHDGVTLIATAEDSLDAVMRPRLEAAGADLDKVAFIAMRRDGIDGGISLPEDVAELDRLVGEKSAKLVIIDPLVAHLDDKVNSWNDQSVRRALAPLHHLAEKHDCSIIVIVHLNKRTGDDPLQRVGGTTGIVAAARSILLLARDPADPNGENGQRRIFAHIKTNYGLIQPSITLSIESYVLDADAEGERVTTSRIFVTGESELTGRELLEVTEKSETKTDAAIVFLTSMLSSGPKPKATLVEAAEREGILERTLRRAAKKIGVVGEREGRGARKGVSAIWSLPQHDDPASEKEF